MDITPNSWQDILKLVIMVVAAAAGSPVTQALKNLFKIEDRWALIVTGAISAVFAVVEMWLSGVLRFSDITVESFPASFFAVFSVATVYYAWLKNSPTFFGKKALLKGA